MAALPKTSQGKIRENSRRVAASPGELQTVQVVSEVWAKRNFESSGALARHPQQNFRN